MPVQLEADHATTLHRPRPHGSPAPLDVEARVHVALSTLGMLSPLGVLAIALRLGSSQPVELFGLAAGEALLRRRERAHAGAAAR
jgi:hypothetical protein